MSATTLARLQAMKSEGNKIAALTAYNATLSRVLSESGVDVLLVGDSLGMVVAGHSDTVPVTLDDVIYHTRCVSRGNRGAFLMADMPFMTYSNPEEALKNAALLIQAGAMMVKLEGGAWLAPTVELLTERGIPVCAHLGLMFQQVNIMGHKIQGRTEEQSQAILKDAQRLEKAGAKCTVLECMPHVLAKKISEALTIPTIGIGAGNGCDGQILVLHDMLGLSPGKPYKFVKDFLQGQASGIGSAIQSYVSEVKEGVFPSIEHSFE